MSTTEESPAPWAATTVHPDSGPKKRYRRQKKLIQPGLQLKLTGTFFIISALSFLLQYLLLANDLVAAANQLPDGGHQVIAMLPGSLLRSLILSFCFLMPVTFLGGVLVTFRIAGPVYRFQVFLRDVRDGKQVEPCRIRKGDELQGLCVLINEATEPVRRQNHLDHVRDEEQAARRKAG